MATSLIHSIIRSRLNMQMRELARPVTLLLRRWQCARALQSCQRRFGPCSRPSSPFRGHNSTQWRDMRTSASAAAAAAAVEDLSPNALRRQAQELGARVAEAIKVRVGIL